MNFEQAEYDAAIRQVSRMRYRQPGKFTRTITTIGLPAASRVLDDVDSRARTPVGITGARVRALLGVHGGDQ